MLVQIPETNQYEGIPNTNFSNKINRIFVIIRKSIFIAVGNVSFLNPVAKF